MTKALVYVAGPYTTPNPVRNTRNAILTGEHLWTHCGVTPVIPHFSLLWDLVSDDDLGYEHWLEYDIELLKRCDALYRLPGESSGADREVAEAERRSIPVLYSPSAVKHWADLRKDGGW